MFNPCALTLLSTMEVGMLLLCLIGTEGMLLSQDIADLEEHASDQFGL